MRRAPASFHSDTIASGHGSPERTVASTNAVPVFVRCRTSAADTGSSSCASSTLSDDAAPAGALDQHVGAVPHQAQRVVRPRVVRDQPGERTERHSRGAARGLHPTDERAVTLGGGVRFAREARLADAGGRAEHHAATRGVSAC